MTSLTFYGGVNEIGGSHILEAVKEIDAKHLYPVHTEHPEVYKKISKNMTLIEEGVKYDLKEVRE